MEFPQLASALHKYMLVMGWISQMCSIFAVKGACIVYWMLMANFLFNTVNVGFGKIRLTNNVCIELTTHLYIP